jgi:hypothetical protein
MIDPRTGLVLQTGRTAADQPRTWNPNAPSSIVNYGSIGGAVLGYMFSQNIIGALIGGAIGWGVYGAAIVSSDPAGFL